MTNLTVDIIVPIHNAPHLTNLCLNSVAPTLQPGKHRLILVNDGSDRETTEILDTFAENHQNTVLLQNLSAQGFTKSANKGLRESFAQMTILLNSDTQVSPGWIEKLAATLFGTTGVGITGPLSNAASYQSIPRTEPTVDERLHRQTVRNELPPGMDIESVNRFLESIDWENPIRVPLIHGFCFAVRSEVISEIGYFDEINFPRGYGEENDFCIRASDAGWSLAITPNTYVWHEKTGSYESSERYSLISNAKGALIEKHGKVRLQNTQAAMRNTAVMISKKLEPLLLKNLQNGTSSGSQTSTGLKGNVR